MSNSQSQRVYLGLGSNRGDRYGYLKQAMDAAAQHPYFSNVSYSSVYETKPVDAMGPDFLNAVISFETSLGAREIYLWIRHQEREAHRERGIYGAPRTLDIDLLIYGQEQIAQTDLVVPHERLHLRAFVLIPLIELAPDLHHPVLGKTSSELLRLLPHEMVEQVKLYENCLQSKTLSENA